MDANSTILWRGGGFLKLYKELYYSKSFELLKKKKPSINQLLFNLPINILDFNICSWKIFNNKKFNIKINIERYSNIYFSMEQKV